MPSLILQPEDTKLIQAFVQEREDCSYHSNDIGNPVLTTISLATIKEFIELCELIDLTPN